MTLYILLLLTGHDMLLLFIVGPQLVASVVAYLKFAGVFRTSPGPGITFVAVPYESEEAKQRAIRDAWCGFIFE